MRAVVWGAQVYLFDTKCLKSMSAVLTRRGRLNESCQERVQDIGVLIIHRDRATRLEPDGGNDFDVDASPFSRM